VLFASFVGLLATVVLAAAERAAEILAIRVPWMREKANSTVATVDRTVRQIGTIAQDGIDRQLILTNNRVDAIVLMPIGVKGKEFPGGYDENPKFSVKILSDVITPSSYELDANASRSRARFFCGLARKD
jgi:hypothetical protein